MDPLLTLGLTGAAAASSAAPGPCILLASWRSATDGLVSGLRVTLGIAASKVMLLACSWSVIFGMLTVSEAAQDAFRWGGIALLLGLALMMLADRPAALAGARRPGRWHLGDSGLGLWVGLSSPMNVIFILALLPQFVELERLSASMVAQASAAVLVGGVTPLVVACLFSTRVLCSRPLALRYLTRLCGGAILCFAGLALVAGP